MPGQTDQLRARKAIAAAHSNASRFTRTARGITKSTPHRTGSLRDIASKASCSKSLVGKVLSSSSSPLETRQRGRPPTLTPVEEVGLVSYIVWLERSGFPADKRQVEDAARFELGEASITSTSASIGIAAFVNVILSVRSPSLRPSISLASPSKPLILRM